MKTYKEMLAKMEDKTVTTLKEIEEEIKTNKAG
jgi:hypothetical protein